MILGVMADGLDVVAVRVVHEGAIVSRVVMGPDARGAIADAAGGERGRVERADLGACRDAERDMDRRPVGRARVDPEVGLGRRPESGHRHRAGDLGAELHQLRVADGGQRRFVERLAGGEVADVDAGVIDHGCVVRSCGIGNSAAGARRHPPRTSDARADART